MWNLPKSAALLLTGGAVIVHSQAQCPDFTDFASAAQGSASLGPLGLPYMRPSPACRTFNSSVVERVIGDMTSRMKDPDLARLFENTFPNTLDTTIKYFNQTENLAFIITGAKPVYRAQWLRDTANQLHVYQSLLKEDRQLQALWKAVLHNEARYITAYPYCGAFQPPPESGLPPSVNDYALDVTVNPPVDNQTVFECKYEIDSLCGFLKLSRTYYLNTNDSSFADVDWYTAISQIFRVMDEQSQGTYTEDFHVVSYYNWTGTAGSLSPPVPNGGNGEPKAYTGMVGTSHRPSDDLSTFAFLIPANAMLSVEMTYLASMLDSINVTSPLSSSARQWSSKIQQGIAAHGIVNGGYAYETNGLGAVYLMDDANVPSLLALPYLGFLDKSDVTYVATRQRLLSRQNPYYAAGQTFLGIGGPHVGNLDNVWPMSLVSGIFGTDDDAEIITMVDAILQNTGGLGLIHESVNIFNQSDYSRPWFAWANSYFAEMILDIAERKPWLIFNSSEPYIVGSGGAM
ncbi:glycoside hydrolase family 125 protein [Calocera cornea HHB12733]|uniref:Glycoside hydrolase family 125 protein n=1 Tax=Calocera cornea HHB12733 TaxID=1353952 RepID=A0A165HA55_9BASI|nr:glycoside hydrolase family 125 protein [Calocera cornea HHB12733]